MSHYKTVRVSSLAQQLRQLGDVRCDAPRFIFSEQLGCGASTRLILEMDIGELLAITVAHDETGVKTCIAVGRWRQRQRGPRRPFAGGMVRRKTLCVLELFTGAWNDGDHLQRSRVWRPWH